METDETFPELNPVIPVYPGSMKTVGTSDPDSVTARNIMAIHAYLVMDQGLDLQSWLEEQLSVR